ncbi:DUF3841 domain-containing protein [Propionibacterium freudenreichii]|uniref:DUF3841 domain-containing protein n=1 Tax=Propionibacterium freudenreichii TaxID=1744 RepID=UPI0021A73BCF|nr:DUF3841 domain-containing protein [Propionibacterium freudenreichii]MCT2981013.1 DUF3841 domain-containing protein [Propionibacterium freudenreichii]
MEIQLHGTLPSPITLWSMQHRSVRQTLKSGKTYRPREEHCWPAVEEGPTPDCPQDIPAQFARAYDWMAERLDHRDPRPDPSLRWPVWAYWSLGPSGMGKPDLRRLRQLEPGVMLELRVDAARVLLSDMDGWHGPLNDSFWGSGKPPFDEDRPASSLSHRERTYVERVKRRSWRRCLAVNPRRFTQAVLWEIRPDDVVSHRFFKGHPLPTVGH